MNDTITTTTTTTAPTPTYSADRVGEMLSYSVKKVGYNGEAYENTMPIIPNHLLTFDITQDKDLITLINSRMDILLAELIEEAVNERVEEEIERKMEEIGGDISYYIENVESALYELNRFIENINY